MLMYDSIVGLLPKVLRIVGIKTLESLNIRQSVMDFSIKGSRELDKSGETIFPCVGRYLEI